MEFVLRTYCECYLLSSGQTDNQLLVCLSVLLFLTALNDGNTSYLSRNETVPAEEQLVSSRFVRCLPNWVIGELAGAYIEAGWVVG